jgi:hemolysin activation/secretion protein
LSTLRLAALSLLGAAAFCPALSHAAENPSDPLRFEIKHFILDGNTLLPGDTAEQLLAPYRGSNKDFADVQRALETLEGAYRMRGYGVVQVTLPEQDITQGAVRFAIIEPQLGKVTIEGNQRFSSENVRRSLPALVEGTPPNSRAISRSLQIANENPAKQTQVLLRSGESESQVNATIKITEDKFWKAGVTLDNTGTSSTGTWRLGARYRHANLFDRDHLLTAQYITSPGHFGDVRIYGMGYRIPFYSLGSSVDVIGGYSDVNSGTLQNLFTVSGSGTVFGLRYNQHLGRTEDYEHRLVYGFDYRAYRNQVAQVGGTGDSNVPDITVHPLSVYYAGQWRTPGSEISFYVYAAQNVFPHGNDAADSDFKVSRADAKAAYRIYRYNFNYTRVFPADFQGRFQFFGQQTAHALVSGEQFGLGGADNVRGFFEREVNNDRGNRFSLELTSPDLATLAQWKSLRVRAAVFYDWGHVRRNHAQAGDTTSESIASVGMGVRLAGANNYSLRIDMARVLQAGGDQQRGDWKTHALLSALF